MALCCRLPQVAASSGRGSPFHSLDVMKISVFASLILAVGLVNSVFAQELRLEGRFEYRIDEESRDVLGDQVCFFPDSLTARQLPREKSDRRLAWFCFTDTSDAKRKLNIPRSTPAMSCGYSGNAVITVTDYKVYRGEGDGNDVALLKKVVSASISEAIKCTQWHPTIQSSADCLRHPLTSNVNSLCPLPRSNIKV